MLSYIGTLLSGMIGYAVFSAVFPNISGKINEYQLKLGQYLKGLIFKNK